MLREPEILGHIVEKNNDFSVLLEEATNADIKVGVEQGSTTEQILFLQQKMML